MCFNSFNFVLLAFVKCGHGEPFVYFMNGQRVAGRVCLTDCDHARHGHDVPQRAVWRFNSAQYLRAIGRAHCARYITHADIGIVGKPG
jgi:hypothetical protein